MRVTRGWLTVVGLAVIALALLLVAGSRGLKVREFALRAPNQQYVALLRPSQRVCEGPVTSQSQTQNVGIWGGPVIGLSKLRVDVQDAATHKTLASGQINAAAPGEYVTSLNKTVPGDRPLRICLLGGLNTFALEGSPAVHPDVKMSGKTPGLEFSLVLLKDNPSLLSSLPTAFSRASLFRPSWVGSWTFWTLATALLATFGLGTVAVASAARADDEDQPDRRRDR